VVARLVSGAWRWRARLWAGPSVVTVGGGGGGWGQCHRHCLARRWINGGDDGEIRVRVSGCRGGDMLARLEGTQRAGRSGGVAGRRGGGDRVRVGRAVGDGRWRGES
jgi:hypothetical protein